MRSLHSPRSAPRWAPSTYPSPSPYYPHLHPLLHHPHFHPNPNPSPEPSPDPNPTPNPKQVGAEYRQLSESYKAKAERLEAQLGEMREQARHSPIYLVITPILEV